ncbi:hypothetical protein Vretimale_3397 [Volvox reticuliferus]|uniref:Uncharacterized protein n=1 Tax=Volvox reticuliferus TaxID=1737510 RepID=A0A8J4G0B2_9CHLO|nr:hypothetical protein Vretimale_3397 [Volvox reticuliferus]
MYHAERSYGINFPDGVGRGASYLSVKLMEVCAPRNQPYGLAKQGPGFREPPMRGVLLTAFLSSSSSSRARGGHMERGRAKDGLAERKADRRLGDESLTVTNLHLGVLIRFELARSRVHRIGELVGS